MKKIQLLILCLSVFISCKKENNFKTPENLLYAKRGVAPGIYDQAGRYVLLRGVNYNVLGDYWQANSSIATTKHYDENDYIRDYSYFLNGTINE